MVIYDIIVSRILSLYWLYWLYWHQPNFAVHVAGRLCAGGQGVCPKVPIWVCLKQSGEYGEFPEKGYPQVDGFNGQSYENGWFGTTFIPNLRAVKWIKWWSTSWFWVASFQMSPNLAGYVVLGCFGSHRK